MFIVFSFNFTLSLLTNKYLTKQENKIIFCPVCSYNVSNSLYDNFGTQSLIKLTAKEFQATWLDKLVKDYSLEVFHKSIDNPFKNGTVNYCQNLRLSRDIMG